MKTMRTTASALLALAAIGLIGLLLAGCGTSSRLLPVSQANRIDDA